MQWNKNKNAGFSLHKPWLKLNPNYKDINVEDNLNNPDSVLMYYKKIIQLRKKYKVIVYGRYQDLWFKNKKLYAYRRFDKDSELVIICNFTEKEYELKNNPYKDYELIISNYKEQDSLLLKPYEARVYKK